MSSPEKATSGEGSRLRVGGISLERAEGLILLMDTPKGRGVFANKDIPAKTVLEVSPVIVLDPAENEEHIKKTELVHYTYNWPYKPKPVKDQVQAQMKRPSMTQAELASGGAWTSIKSISNIPKVVLGLGSMFNHSNLHQNVGWERDLTNLLITYSTLQDIKAGEELCISYGQRLTFKDTEEEVSENGPEDWTEVLNIIDLID